MAINLVQTGDDSSTSGGGSVTLASAVTTGNRLIAAQYGPTSTPTITDTAGLTWTLDANTPGMYVFSAPVTVSGAITVTSSSTGAGTALILSEWSGVGSVDVVATAVNGSATVTTSSSSELVVGAFGQTNSGSRAPVANTLANSNGTLADSDAYTATYGGGANDVHAVVAFLSYQLAPTSGAYSMGANSTAASGVAVSYVSGQTPLDTSGAFVGIGSLSAPTIVEETTTSGGFVGVGSLSAAPMEVEETGGVFTGVGNLSASVTLQSPYIAGAFVGVGSLSASADLIEPAAGGFVGVGSLSATPDEGESSSGAFFGIGTLSAPVGVVEKVSAGFVGVGSLAVATAERVESPPPTLYVFSAAESLECVLIPQDGATPTGTPVCPFYNAIHTVQIFNATNAAQGQVQNQLVFDVPANHPDAAYVVKGAWIAFLGQSGQYELFEVTLTDEHDTSSGEYKTATCTQAGQAELIDEFISSLALSSLTPSTALTDVLNGTRWSPGNVSVTATSQSLTLTQTNVLAALTQLVTTWGGELSFRVTISGNSITGRYVDWVQQVGSVTGKRYEFGKDIKSVQRTVDTTNLFTAVYGFGATNNTTNVPLTFASVTWTTPPNPANKPSGQTYVSDPNALALYGRAGGTRNRSTSYTDSNQTDAATLLQEAWDYLQTVNTPTVTYQMSVADLSQISGYAHEKVLLGDTVNVIDLGIQPPLQEQMRVIELARDLVNPLNTQVTLGTFRPTTVTTASNALTALQNASAAAAQAAQATTAATSATTTATSALSSATTAITTANQASATASTALQPGSPLDTAYLSGVISADQNALQSAGGYVTVDSNGITIMNASTLANATQALKLAGGIFGISNTKDSNGNFVYTTFGTGAGFDASQINTGTLDASVVDVTNLNATNITTGDMNLGGPNNMNLALWNLTAIGSGYAILVANQQGVYMSNNTDATTFTYATTGQTTTAGHALAGGDVELLGRLWVGLNGNGYIEGDTSLHLSVTTVGDHFLIRQSPSNGDASFIPTSNDVNLIGESGFAFRGMYSYAFNNASSGAWKEAVRAHNIAESIKVIYDLSLQDYVVKGETRQRVGLIAEDSPVEVQSEDGQGIDLYAVIAHLVGAVQDLQAKVYKLEGGS